MNNGKKEVYLLAGHSSNDPGAIGVNGRKEADETVKLRNAIKTRLEANGISVIIDDNRDNLRTVLAKIESGEEDIIFDIHFNASENAKATGIESFIPARHTSLEMNTAAQITMGLATLMGLKYRGVKTEIESHRGSLGVMKEKGTTILLEMCFISNPADMGIYDSKFNEIASFIANVLTKAAK